MLASIIGREAPASTLWPMRVLVDECLPERIGGVLDRMRPEHRFEHVRALGRAGATNGKLQADAYGEGFEAMVTGDVNMELQMPSPSMPVVVIPTSQCLSSYQRIAAWTI